MRDAPSRITEEYDSPEIYDQEPVDLDLGAHFLLRQEQTSMFAKDAIAYTPKQVVTQ